MKQRILKKEGIKLSCEKLGMESFVPITKRQNSSTLGIALETGIPKGLMMLFIGSCPSGWQKVTGVNNYHLRITNVEGDAGTTNAADSLSHTHSWQTNMGSGSDALNCTSVVSTVTPTVVYPAHKYILCERI